MSERIRLVGIGQPAAGDDGVGIAVVREVAKQPWSYRLAIHETNDPLRLIDWLDTGCRMILVDAVVGNGRCGTIARLGPDDLAGGSAHPVSSHGLNVAQVIELSNVITKSMHRPKIDIIAVTIQEPFGASTGLSSHVAAAVPKAVALVQELVSPPW
jgi:hydrogenase maturation protease